MKYSYNFQETMEIRLDVDYPCLEIVFSIGNDSPVLVDVNSSFNKIYTTLDIGNGKAEQVHE